MIKGATSDYDEMAVPVVLRQHHGHPTELLATITLGDRYLVRKTLDVIRRVVRHSEVEAPIAIEVTRRQAVRAPHDLDAIDRHHSDPPRRPRTGRRAPVGWPAAESRRPPRRQGRPRGRDSA